jgi:hypothetical protein
MMAESAANQDPMQVVSAFIFAVRVPANFQSVKDSLRK